MDKVVALVTGLFTDPKATMYSAREPESKGPTLMLAGAAIVLQALLSLLSGTPIVVCLLLAPLGFLSFFFAVWIGGLVTGGSGSAQDILQICGLVYLPLSIVHGVAAIVHLSLIGSVVSCIVMYYAILIGHSFSGFRDVIFAYVVGLLASIIAFVILGALLTALSR